MRLASSSVVCWLLLAPEGSLGFSVRAPLPNANSFSHQQHHVASLLEDSSTAASSSPWSVPAFHKVQKRAQSSLTKLQVATALQEPGEMMSDHVNYWPDQEESSQQLLPQQREVLDKDFRVAGYLLGMGAILPLVASLIQVFGSILQEVVGPLFGSVGYPVIVLAVLLGQRTLRLELECDEESFGLSGKQENPIVGGGTKSRWDYENIVNYEFFPKGWIDQPQGPLIAYFKEVQTPVEKWDKGLGAIANSEEALANGAVPGQVHFLPALFDAQKLRDNFEQRGVPKIQQAEEKPSSTTGNTPAHEKMLQWVEAQVSSVQQEMDNLPSNTGSTPAHEKMFHWFEAKVNSIFNPDKTRTKKSGNEISNSMDTQTIVGPIKVEPMQVLQELPISTAFESSMDLPDIKGNDMPHSWRSIGDPLGMYQPLFKSTMHADANAIDNKNQANEMPQLWRSIEDPLGLYKPLFKRTMHVDANPLDMKVKGNEMPQSLRGTQHPVKNTGKPIELQERNSRFESTIGHTESTVENKLPQSLGATKTISSPGIETSTLHIVDYPKEGSCGEMKVPKSIAFLAKQFGGAFEDGECSVEGYTVEEGTLSGTKNRDKDKTYTIYGKQPAHETSRNGLPQSLGVKTVPLPNEGRQKVDTTTLHIVDYPKQGSCGEMEVPKSVAFLAKAFGGGFKDGSCSLEGYMFEEDTLPGTKKHDKNKTYNIYGKAPVVDDTSNEHQGNGRPWKGLVAKSRRVGTGVLTMVCRPFTRI